MYKYLLVLLILIANSIQAQVIDSIIVSTDTWTSDSHGPAFTSASVDSFSNGRLIDSVSFDNNWQMTFHYKDSFDLSGNLIMENGDDYFGGFQNIFHFTYTYNGFNQLTYTLKNNFYSNPISSHLTYDVSNRLIQIVDSVNNGNWVPQNKTVINYYPNDSVNEIIDYRWASVMWILKDRHRYNYAANYRNDTLLILDSLTGIEKYSQLITRFSYNGIDTMILTQSFNSTSQLWDSIYMESFVYVQAPLRLTQWIKFQYGGGWVMADGEAYTYDTSYRLIHIHNLKPDLCQNDEGFVYNADGTLSIYSVDNVCPNSFSSLERRYYYSGGIFSIFLPGQMDICSSDSVPVLGSNLLNSPGIHYQWSPSYGLSNDTILNPYVFANTTTAYQLFITDQLGNSDTLQMNVNVKPGPPLDIVITSLDTVLPCYSFDISADSTNSYPGIYEWYFNGAPLHVPFGANHTSHSLNGTFTVVASANNGCVRTDSLVVNLMPPANRPVIHEDVCNNYLFTSFPGAALYKWVWDGFGIGFYPPDTFNVQNVTYDDVSYYVVVEDSNGCKYFSDPIWTHPKMNNHTYIKEGCGGQCDAVINFKPDDAFSPYSIIWSTGDTTYCTSCASIIHPGHCSGYSWAQVTDNDGCVVIDSFYIAPNLHTFSVITQLVPDPAQSCSGSIQIQTISSDTSSNIYMCVNDTSCDWFNADTLLQNLCWGSYSIKLYNDGCIYTDSVTIDSLAMQTQEIIYHSINLFPNPVNGLLSINTNSSPFNVVISSITGQMIYSDNSDRNNYMLDCSRFENGLYIVTIIQKENSVRRKVLILH